MDFDSIEKLFDAKLQNVHTKLDSIKSQTERTNGRVTKAEKRLSTHDKALWVGLGAFMAVELISNVIF